MTYRVTRNEDRWIRHAESLEDAQQYAQGVAEGPLKWSCTGGGRWEATDPDTRWIYLVEEIHPSLMRRVS